MRSTLTSPQRTAIGCRLARAWDLTKMEEIEKAHHDAIGVVVGYDMPTEDNPYASGDRALNFFKSKDKEKSSNNSGLRILWDEYKKLVSKINK